MRTALRTAIATALVAGIAITAPALATGAAFAADGPVAVSTSEAKRADTGAGAGGTAGAAQGTLVRTETLHNGTVVKVYKLGPAWYRAESFKNGRSIGTLETGNRATAGNDNGDYLVLFADGRTLAWRGDLVSPAPLGLYRLADGTVVELGKNPADGRFGFQLIDGAGKGRGFSYAYHPVRSVWTYGKAVVVLEADGGFAAHVPGAAEQGKPEYLGKSTGTPEATPSPTGPSKPAATRSPAPVISGPTAVGPCTVTEVIASSYGGGWTVTLTNDLEKGPKAVLEDEKGKVLDTVDRAHPGPTGPGSKIVRADTRTPRFGQHTNGGDTAPYRWNDFPKLPENCGTTATPTAPATHAPQTDAQGGQTSVVPKGGVAAGADFGTVEQDNDDALLASSAGAALVVAGLGFTTLRRRRAAVRG
ncbi:hypothetical protein [Streptomyces sp. NPDC004266]|uniref:hypothetical protein n=1 Tax=Streptomyces sp. NPDC004266 TaxID=3364693 RepID=UPI0036A7E50F